MKQIFLITGLFFLFSTAFSEIIIVPSQYINIQLAIDNSSDGDTIFVEAGIFLGSGNYDINFYGKEIVLKSLSGAENTIIDCQNNGRGFLFQSGENSSTIVDGFTIKNGHAIDYGGGISCFWGSPTINNCIITENYSERGGGISLRNSDAHIINCSINNNNATWGGGVFIYESSIFIDSTIISENICGYASLKVSTNSDLNISNSIIVNNTNGQSGTVGAYYGCSLNITNCFIQNNDDDGINITNGSSLNLTNTIISKNSDCGIWASNAGQINIINSDIIYNANNGIYSQSTPFNIKNTIIYGNIANQIYLWSEPIPYIEYSNIENRLSGGIVGMINWGDGNLDVIPEFINIEEDNFRLFNTSLCNGAGNIINAPEFDIDNNPRPLPTLSNPDIGAYETDQTISNISNNGINSNIEIYPNPTTGIFNFEFKDNNIQKITLLDITGKQIFERVYIQKNEQIDLSNFESGIYIISIQTNEKIFSSKIIKR